MSTAVAHQPETRIMIPNISWEIFEALGNSDCASTRFAYDQGVLEIMSPSNDHEAFHKLLGQMVEMMATELNIPRRSLGATTLKDQLEKRGVEPDESYYLAHMEMMRGKRLLDISIDPPPDLAIEVDISHSSLDKLTLYASIGVPELWLYDGETIRVYLLQNNKTYYQQDSSAAFPFLDLRKIEYFLESFDYGDETAWSRSFRDWVREQYGHLAR
jgi:Uma2 family endonuclease